MRFKKKQKKRKSRLCIMFSYASICTRKTTNFDEKKNNLKATI